MKKIIAIICALTLVLALAACGGSSAPASAPTEAPAADAPAEAPVEAVVYNVGICQLVQHVALDAASQGFQDKLTELLDGNVNFNYQNASGDPATCAVIVNQFVSDDVDLIMANATASLQAAAAATNQIPVLGTAITAYNVALDIPADEWPGYSGTNISGTSDLPPLDEQAAMLAEWFPVDEYPNVGLIYCSGEPNSIYQVTVVGAELKAMGYTVIDYSFADSNDLSAVVTNACSECDVLYVPTDNTAAAATETINNIAQPAGVPIIAGEEGICQGCGVATLSISYYDLGVATAEMAYEILVNGADVSTMEIGYAPVTAKYNPAMCEALGITPLEGYEAIA